MNELKELTEKVASFEYIPTFSREVPENYDHLIRTGYVHGVYEEIIKAWNGTARPASFYLCGWKNMIDEAKQRIVALGYDKKSIHQELYG